MKRSLFLILFCALFQSCAGMIDQMYREFDQADGQEVTSPSTPGNFDMYRGNANFKSNRRPPTSAMVNSQVSSAQQPNVRPGVQRQYEQAQGYRPRVRADDLRDNGSNGSLWAADNGKTTQLFTNTRDVQNGDIVLINVYNKLKNEITLELKRAFPEPIAAQTEKKETTPAETPNADQVNTAQASPRGGDENFDEGVSGTNRVYDRISSVIIEQIDDQHLLLRGRKDVLYKNRKRLVEIQALIPKRDLNDNNTINSDSILEQTITVLR